MPFPKTEAELTAAGYVFKNRARCKGSECGKEILWYETPKHRMVPLDPGTLEVHWATCPNSPNFRGKKKT